MTYAELYREVESLAPNETIDVCVHTQRCVHEKGPPTVTTEWRVVVFEARSVRHHISGVTADSVLMSLRAALAQQRPVEEVVVDMKESA